MADTTNGTARRLSRRALLGGVAATAGAALLAACGGSSATATPQTAATRVTGAATNAAPTTNAAASSAAGAATSAAPTTASLATTITGAATSAAPTVNAAASSAAGAATANATTVNSAASAVSGTTTAAGSAVTGTTTSSTAGKFSGTIKVGSKDFTEEFIVGNMYALLLENAGAKVDRKLNLGGTPVCQAAMEKGDLDLYPEYTGTGLVTVLKLPADTDPKRVYDTVNKGYQDKYKFTWLDPAPMNNTQALAMTQQGSQKFGIKTISDMVAKADQLTMIGPPEFEQREDGLPGIMKVYGNFKLKKYIGVDPGLKYKGLTEGQADVSVAFGTDGEIAAFNLVVLQDDKHLFPVYQIAPVVTNKALDASPGIRDALNKLAPLLTDDTMRKLNYEVDGNKKEPADVAKTFLMQQGLLK